MRLVKEWVWNNPHNGQSSHSMRVEFDIDATTDRQNVFVKIRNLRMSGANGSSPDAGTTQDHIVLSSKPVLPATQPAPPRPISLPFPGDIANRGAFAELATYLNRGNPQRFFWGNTSADYTIPYEGPDTTVVYSLYSAFQGNNIVWGLGEFKVSLRDLRYVPMEGKKGNTFRSFNLNQGLEGKKSGRYHTTWNYFGNTELSSGQGKKNNTFKVLELE